MKYKIKFYFLADRRKTPRFETISANDHRQALSKFYDQIKEGVFILEINEETKL